MTFTPIFKHFLFPLGILGATCTLTTQAMAWTEIEPEIEVTIPDEP